MDVRLHCEFIRCFATHQVAVIRPVTLLIGENSSGKSTFLALCHIASVIVKGINSEIPFNDPPFLLGAYDQIASYRGGRAGRAKTFSITLEIIDNENTSKAIKATFASKDGQPTLDVWKLTVGHLSIEVRLSNPRKPIVLLTGSKGSVELAQSLRFYGLPWFDALSRDMTYILSRESTRKVMEKVSKEELQVLSRAWHGLHGAFGRGTYAFAPIRTSPQRTYDPVTAEPRPEGSHVPMLLARLSHHSRGAQRPATQEALNNFGSNSGLFDEIEVIRKGKKESDPFQIVVRSGGPPFNLVDVGYGVSQVLPILVDTLQAENRDSVFLMQQPEVHLHPKAQAELGTFFARLANRERRFIVETHSDYLVDRIRMEVGRRNTIKPEDVSILYFERRKSGVAIHNLCLDEGGSVRNAPDGYRQFFLDEEHDLLGI